MHLGAQVIVVPPVYVSFCQRDQKIRVQVILAPLSDSAIWHICLFFTLPYPFPKLINTNKNNNYQTQKLTINHNKQTQ
jgi:hypothetical protein